MTSTDVSRLTVHLGDHNIKTKNEVQHIEKRVKRVVRHRSFDTRTLYNDVALLTLDTPVQFTKTVRPICLPRSDRHFGGMYGTVIGWGSLRESEYTLDCNFDGSALRNVFLFNLINRWAAAGNFAKSTSSNLDKFRVQR